jgi:hypothetical protein
MAACVAPERPFCAPGGLRLGRDGRICAWPPGLAGLARPGSGDGRDQAGPAFGRASSRAFSRLSALPWRRPVPDADRPGRRAAVTAQQLAPSTAGCPACPPAPSRSCRPGRAVAGGEPAHRPGVALHRPRRLALRGQVQPEGPDVWPERPGSALGPLRAGHSFILIPRIRRRGHARSAALRRVKEPGRVRFGWHEALLCPASLRS